MPKKLSKSNGDTRPTVKDKNMNGLLKDAWDAGCEMALGGNNHVKCYPPKGPMVPVPSTPSGSRTLDNKRAQLRRGGLDL